MSYYDNMLFNTVFTANPPPSPQPGGRVDARKIHPCAPP